MVDTSRKWSGEWWVCSEEIQDVSRVPGVLSYTEDGYMELALSPAPNGPSLKCKGQQNYTIWGEDKNGYKITLFNSYIKKYDLNMRALTMLVNSAVIGVHISSLDTPFFRQAAIIYPNLKEFLFVPQVEWEHEGKSIIFKIEDKPNAEIIIPMEEGLNWILRGAYKWTAKNRCIEVEIKQDTRFVVKCNDQQSVKFFQRQVDEFSDFLSLALLGNQNPTEMFLYITDDPLSKCEYLYCVNESAKCRFHLIGNSAPIERVPFILKNWHKNYDQIAPIYRYLDRSSFDNHGTIGIPEFLLVEYALEGYFKRFHNKTKTEGKDVRKLEDQLKKLLEYYKEVELISKLNLDIPAVVDTRDAYTHLIPEEEMTGHEMKDAHQIWVNTEKLRILLYCCLLESMGFTTQEINTNFKTAPIVHPERYQNDFLFE